MTIDEAISHALEEAEQEESIINYPHSDIVLGDLDIESRKHYVAEQRQLAEWLKELKELRSLKTDYVFFKAEAKKLLRAAVEDFSYCSGIYGLCYYNIGCGVCADCNNTPCNEFQWRYADEALALIGEDGDTNG